MCLSQKGTLIEIRKETFLSLKGNGGSQWKNVIHNIEKKEKRIAAWDRNQKTTQKFIEKGQSQQPTSKNSNVAEIVTQWR